MKIDKSYCINSNTNKTISPPERPCFLTSLIRSICQIAYKIFSYIFCCSRNSSQPRNRVEEIFGKTDYSYTYSDPPDPLQTSSHKIKKTGFLETQFPSEGRVQTDSLHLSTRYPAKEDFSALKRALDLKLDALRKIRSAAKEYSHNRYDLKIKIANIESEIKSIERGIKKIELEKDDISTDLIVSQIKRMNTKINLEAKTTDIDPKSKEDLINEEKNAALKVIETEKSIKQFDAQISELTAQMKLKEEELYLLNQSLIEMKKIGNESVASWGRQLSDLENEIEKCAKKANVNLGHSASYSPNLNIDFDMFDSFEYGDFNHFFKGFFQNTFAGMQPTDSPLETYIKDAISIIQSMEPYSPVPNETDAQKARREAYILFKEKITNNTSAYSLFGFKEKQKITLRELRKKYFEICRMIAPDKHPIERRKEATALFQCIQQAFTDLEKTATRNESKS